MHGRTKLEKQQQLVRIEREHTSASSCKQGAWHMPNALFLANTTSEKVQGQKGRKRFGLAVHLGCDAIFWSSWWHLQDTTPHL
jgi:hypothetical protein